MQIQVAPHIQKARQTSAPIVALETTMLTHGLPAPQNTLLAKELLQITQKRDVTAAFIGVMAGKPIVGLDLPQIQTLAVKSKSCLKLSQADIPYAIATNADGATTVSGTSFLAHKSGICVFATGGIGGVHRGYGKFWDVSNDLECLAKTPLVIVCSGAKSILDVPSTMEYLETKGILAVGWQCSKVPGFYSHSSPFSLPYSVDSLEQIKTIYENLDGASLIIMNPIPKEHEIPWKSVQEMLDSAFSHMKEENITGKQQTPFLLAKLNQLSQGKTLEANIELIKSNTRIACDIAKIIRPYP